MERALGIDVSHHHPITSWSAVLAAGVSFVGAKATQGRAYTDPTFTAHRNGARQQPFDLVWYFHYATPGDPKTQAGHLMDTVGPLRGNERLVLDLEGATVSDLPAAPAAVLAWTGTFYGELLNAYSDRRPLIYTSKRIWTMIGNPAWALASQIDLIAPRYSAHEPELPAPWSKWTAWQFSETHDVPGVSGPCDASWFAGDEAELRAYAKLAPQIT